MDTITARRCSAILHNVADIIANDDQVDDAGLLARFIAERCHPAAGQLVLFQDFRREFYRWASEHEPHRWTLKRIKAELPKEYPFGVTNHNQRAIGNLALHPVMSAPDASPVELIAGRLRIGQRPTKRVQNASLQIAKAMRAEGASFQKIADALNAARYTTRRGRRFTWANVRNTLLS